MRFPKRHIADSVLERINQLGIQEQRLSQQLDQALMTPPAAIPAPVGSQDAAILEMQQGGSALDAIGSLNVLDTLA